MLSKRLIINLRGANASGKSTLARGLLAHKVEELGTPQWPQHRCVVPGVHTPVIVLGRYPGGVRTGGCDTIYDSVDHLELLIRGSVEIYPEDHLFFEGVRVSTSGTRWIAFARDMEKRGLGHMLWLFLLVPDEVRRQRTVDRNGGREPAENHTGLTVRNLYRNIRDSFPGQVEQLPWDCPVEDTYLAMVQAIAGAETLLRLEDAAQ